MGAGDAPTIYLRSVETGKVMRRIAFGDRTFGQAIAIADGHGVVGL